MITHISGSMVLEISVCGATLEAGVNKVVREATYRGWNGNIRFTEMCDACEDKLALYDLASTDLGEGGGSYGTLTSNELGDALSDMASRGLVDPSDAARFDALGEISGVLLEKVYVFYRRQK